MLHAGSNDSADRGLHCSFQFFTLLLRRNVMPQMARNQFDEGLADEARFSGARDSRDGGEDAQGKCRIEMMKIVARDAGEFEPGGGFPGTRPTRGAMLRVCE